MRIILCSGSPRRKSLLESLGLEVEVVIPKVKEKLKRGETPDEYTMRLAEEKELYVSGKMRRDDSFSEAVKISADTVVVVDDQILGKPKDREDAARMLRLLSGRRHEVVTGYGVGHKCLLCLNKEHTRVKFRKLTDDEITAYVNTGECDDKAGAYAIQGKGSLLIEGITGDYYNVMGLPLCKIQKTMKQMNLSML